MAEGLTRPGHVAGGPVSAPHADLHRGDPEAGRALVSIACPGVAPRASSRAIAALLAESGGVLVRPLSPEYTLADFEAENGERAVPLLVLSETGKLTVVSPKQTIPAQAGQRLISIATHAAGNGEEA